MGTFPKGANPNTALVLALGVTDQALIAETVRRAEACFDGIDVLANDVGYRSNAAVGEADKADADALFTTNFPGQWR
jgi:NAD(P)-dependent dehydrogenase (short-subunit alcohol dehydrogenase family)